MRQQKKIKFLNISILLSIISIVLTVLINYQIAREYLRVDGKTRALFGITELLQFGYQYYVAIPGIISLILAILSIKGNGLRTKKSIAVLVSLFAITIVFARIWRFFVY